MLALGMKWPERISKLPVIVAILVALGWFGLDFSGYRPAWAFELQATNAIVFSEVCLRLKREWYDAKEIETEYLRKLEPIPSWLRDSLIDLEAKLKEFECPASR